MTAIKSYRDLDVWQRSMNLAVSCFEATRAFPPQERFGLGLQIRRSAVSIPSNIAEGFNRQSRAAYINHLTISRGSQGELDTQVELAARVHLIAPETCRALLIEIEGVGQMLGGLVRSLERSR